LFNEQNEERKEKVFLCVIMNSDDDTHWWKNKNADDKHTFPQSTHYTMILTIADKVGNWFIVKKDTCVVLLLMTLASWMLWEMSYDNMKSF